MASADITLRLTDLVDLAGLNVELDKALECLSDEFNAVGSGPSGLRAQAIAHVRQALLLLHGRANSQVPH